MNEPAALDEAIRAELACLDPAAGPFDVHAHTGADIDGTVRDSASHVRDLEAVGGRSAIFPLCVRDGYAAENERILAECRAEPERLVPFARIDPRAPGAGPTAAAALAAGAVGLKLHPRAEQFALEHPGVDAVLAAAAAARAPVLIHAGLGVGSFGPVLLALAERHRECPIVLAHAAISDLVWLHAETAAHPNLFFDTAWWNPSDLIALFSLVPPGRILFGSDAPYMDLETVLAISLRCARFAGLGPDAVELVAGAQLERLLAGEPAADAGPPPGPPQASPSPLAARAVTALTAFGVARLSGGDPAQMLDLARLTVGDGTALGESGLLVAALLEQGAVADLDAPWAVAVALTRLLTPGVEDPVAAV